MTLYPQNKVSGTGRGMGRDTFISSIFSFDRNVARSHYSRNCCFHREAKASIVKSLGMYELWINFFEEKRDFDPIQKTSKLGTLSGNLFGQKISVP